MHVKRDWIDHPVHNWSIFSYYRETISDIIDISVRSCLETHCHHSLSNSKGQMWGSYPLLTSRHSLQLILCTISTFQVRTRILTQRKAKQRCNCLVGRKGTSPFTAGKKFRRAKQTIMKTKKTPAPQIEHRSWPSRPCWCNGNPGQMERPSDLLGSSIKASFKSSRWYSLWFRATSFLQF